MLLLTGEPNENVAEDRLLGNFNIAVEAALAYIQDIGGKPCPGKGALLASASTHQRHLRKTKRGDSACTIPVKHNVRDLGAHITFQRHTIRRHHQQEGRQRLPHHGLHKQCCQHQQANAEGSSSAKDIPWGYKGSSLRHSTATLSGNCKWPYPGALGSSLNHTSYGVEQGWSAEHGITGHSGEISSPECRSASQHVFDGGRTTQEGNGDGADDDACVKALLR